MNQSFFIWLYLFRSHPGGTAESRAVLEKVTQQIRRWKDIWQCDIITFHWATWRQPAAFFSDHKRKRGVPLLPPRLAAASTSEGWPQWSAVKTAVDTKGQRQSARRCDGNIAEMFVRSVTGVCFIAQEFLLGLFCFQCSRNYHNCFSHKKQPVRDDPRWPPLSLARSCHNHGWVTRRRLHNNGNMLMMRSCPGDWVWLWMSRLDHLAVS